MIQMTQNARNHDTDVTVQIVQNINIDNVCQRSYIFVFINIQNVETANEHRTSY